VLAGEELDRQRDDILDALRRDLEAARYSAERAQRQFDASDPENRLVTAELERRWNLALQHAREIELRIEQHGATAAPTPTPSLEEFHKLSQQLETIWTHPATSVRLKKRIVRTLIEEIFVDVDSSAGEVILTLHWKGGAHTEVRLPRRRRGQCSTQTSHELIDAIEVLARICSDDLIAGILNRNGHLTGRGNRWTRERVAALRSHHRIPSYQRDEQPRGDVAHDRVSLLAVVLAVVAEELGEYGCDGLRLDHVVLARQGAVRRVGQRLGQRMRPVGHPGRALAARRDQHRRLVDAFGQIEIAK
jgi:hypothetical protein